MREHRHADRDREREMFHAVRDDVHDVHDDPFVIKRVVLFLLMFIIIKSPTTQGKRGGCSKSLLVFFEHL